MKIYDIEVHGVDRALRGLARSYNSSLDRMYKRALTLSPLDRGHNKFLRQIAIWAEVEAPRFWWAEYDTYKVGTVAQSDSTMHTLHKKPFTQEDFEYPIYEETLDNLNMLRGLYIEPRHAYSINIEEFKNELPEGFLQGRTLTLNYAVLREIILQRHSHKLPQWPQFILTMYDNIPMPDLLGISSEIILALRQK